MSKEVQDIISKALSGLVAVVATIGITLGGFALKSNYDAQLSIKELDVKMFAIEQSLKDNRDDIAAQRLKMHEMELFDIQHQSNLKGIKDDLNEIKDILKENK